MPFARKAVTLRPADPRYAWTLGFYQARAGDLRGATATLEALLRDDPGYGETYGLLADLYARQGRGAEAAALRQRGPRPSP